MMTVGTGGFSGSAAASGPVAGFDPMLDFRKKMARRIKDHPYAQEYKAKRAKAKKKMKESVEKPCPTPHLYQYKVGIPEIGQTIIYASSAAELMQKLRLLVNPRYRGEINISRVFPSEAGKFYNEKRMKAYRNIPEEVVQESSGGNIDAIKKIADSNQPGKIQFLNGESFQLQPAIAQKIFQAYERLGIQKNRAKFSNAANETSQSFEKILSFVGAQG